jgi:hypothetical protein
MSDDIRTDLARLREDADRYRAEATALHATMLERVAELEERLSAAEPPKPPGLPTGPGLWWPTVGRPLEVYRTKDSPSLRIRSEDCAIQARGWRLDPIGNAIPCPEPDPTRVQLTGPVVRFEPHGAVLDGDWTKKRFSWEQLRKFACESYGCSPDELTLDIELAAILGVYAVYTTPDHAAAWRAELGEG